MKNPIYYCKMASKHIYSSECSATRAMEKYEDIKRVYQCSHCDKWHTTSMSKEEYFESIGKEVSLSDSQEDMQSLVERRLNELTNKVLRIDPSCFKCRKEQAGKGLCVTQCRGCK